MDYVDVCALYQSLINLQDGAGEWHVACTVLGNPRVLKRRENILCVTDTLSRLARLLPLRIRTVEGQTCFVICMKGYLIFHVTKR